MQIPTDQEPGGQTNQDPHTGKHCLLQKQYQASPLAGLCTQLCQPSFDHLCHAEERLQEQHDHTVEDKQQSPLPSHTIGPLVQHISNYPSTKPVTQVSAIWVHNWISHVTSKIVESALCDGVVAAGKAKLRIHCHKIGTHSIRTGAAMAMYLGGVLVFAIMMIGQWLSTAFMKYIRKQIEDFTLNVSKNMLTMQHFCHTPNTTSSPTKKEYGGLASMMLVQNMV
jgi:hypothetical protein